MIVKIEKEDRNNQLEIRNLAIYSKVLSLHVEKDKAESTFLYLEIEGSEEITIVPLIKKEKNSQAKEVNIIWLMNDQGKTIERINI